MKQLKVLVLIVASFMLTPAWCAGYGWLPQQYQLQLQGNYADYHGYAQIPNGGQPGSTSHQRPDFKEFNIGNTFFYDAKISMEWERVGFYAGYQRIRASGDGVLENSLTTHGQVFNAGTQVHGDTRFDWYRTGLYAPSLLGARDLYFAPAIELVVMDFGYDISGNGNKTGRHFRHLVPRLAVFSEYEMSDRWALSLDMGSTLPSSNLQVLNAETKLQFAFLQTDTAEGRVFMGAGAQRIQFQDSQTVPNRFRLRLIPYGIAGVTLTV